MKEIIKKQCTKCDRELPATEEYFHKKKNGKYGLNQVCKECRHKFAEERKLKKLDIINYKQCVICNKILSINDFEDNKDYCINCSMENKIDESKTCTKCNRNFPLTKEYFHKDKYTNDGFSTQCKECRTGNIIFFKIKAKDGYKFCIKCNRELPIDIKYFPPDKMCKDGLRNVCRECGKDGHFMEDDYIPKRIWSNDENQVFIERYPNYTSEELINLFYHDETMKSLSDRAYKLGCGCKTEETKQRANEHKSRVLSEMFKGKIVSEETRKKLSQTKKKQYSSGELISHWKGRIVTDEERKRISNRKKGVWSGKNNPRYLNPLKGELNGNWKGGVKPIYFYLRDFIKQWKIDSVKAYNYKCALTGLNLDNIHHLTPFKDIVDEVFESLNLNIKPSLGDYSENELKNIENKLIELHNKYGLGVPLYKTIHKLFHDTFGYTKITPEDFYKFKENYYKGIYDNELEEELKSYNSLKRVKNLQQVV